MRNSLAGKAVRRRNAKPSHPESTGSSRSGFASSVTGSRFARKSSCGILPCDSPEPSIFSFTSVMDQDPSSSVPVPVTQFPSLESRLTTRTRCRQRLNRHQALLQYPAMRETTGIIRREPYEILILSNCNNVRHSLQMESKDRKPKFEACRKIPNSI